MNKILDNAEWETYFSYLYTDAMINYPDCADIEALIADSMLAMLEKLARGETVEHPKAYLSGILKNKHNAYLREKYHNNISFYDCTNIPCEQEEKEEHGEEYEAVRRELSRLIKIYREVAVRYYVHGHSVEKISRELGISSGTVKSRLSTARERVKEGVSSVKKYSDYSYEPKKHTIGIWGSKGLGDEPFSSAAGSLKGNILILAYERPLSVQGIADTMGVACAYIEEAVEELVRDELLGKTTGGLVYTRCYVQNMSESFGDIEAQTMAAKKYAKPLWELCEPYLEKLNEEESFKSMNEKQRGTLYLFIIHQAISSAIRKHNPDNLNSVVVPERKNGGRWYATLTVVDSTEASKIYGCSGPCHVGYHSENAKCEMFDFQSVFGDSHWAYGAMPLKVGMSEILRFYASLLDSGVTFEYKRINELVPEFEALHIVRRDENGELRLDIPALTYDEVKRFDPTLKEMTSKVCELLREPLCELFEKRKNKIPAHVDGREYFVHNNAAGAYNIAQLMAIVSAELMPYHIEIGKTPIIYLAYKKKENIAE